MKLLPAIAAFLAVPIVAGAESRLELTVFGGLSIVDASTTRPLESQQVCSGPLRCVELARSIRNSLGPSFAHGAALSYQLSGRSTLEIAFASAPSHRLLQELDLRCPSSGGCGGFEFLTGTTTNSFDAPVSPAYHVDLSLRYAPSSGDVRPFVAAGLGWVEYNGEPRGDWSANLGAGLELKLAERLKARIEAIDHVVTKHFLTDETEHDVHVRIGVTVRP